MIYGQEKMTATKIVYIFTLGWSPEFVIRPLLEEGISNGATIVLLASKPETEYATKRVEEAYNQIKNFLAMAGVTDLRYVEVDLNQEFLRVCRDIVRAIKEFIGVDRLKFYLTGGMRILIVATLVVARLLGAVHRVEVELSREDRPVTYSIPLSILEASPRMVTKTQLEVLRQLKVFSEARFEDLALDRSSVTVRKHLTKLREMGLVTHISRARKQVYRLTPLGELLLEVLG